MPPAILKQSTAVPTQAGVVVVNPDGTSIAGSSGGAGGSAANNATTAVLSQVPSNLATVVLKAANANRKGLMVFNDSTANLFLTFAGAASATVYTVKLAAGALFELPVPVYTGAISGIWDAANGNAIVTETT